MCGSACGGDMQGGSVLKEVGKCVTVHEGVMWRVEYVEESRRVCRSACGSDVKVGSGREAEF